MKVRDAEGYGLCDDERHFLRRQLQAYRRRIGRGPVQAAVSSGRQFGQRLDHRQALVVGDGFAGVVAIVLAAVVPAGAHKGAVALWQNIERMRVALDKV